MASDKKNLKKLNLGCVIYKLTKDGLEAEWVRKTSFEVTKGTGKAIRLSKVNPEKPFEGKFEMKYRDKLNNISLPITLNILFEQNIYDLTWSTHGKVTDIGFGIISSNNLVVSFSAIK